MNSKHIIIFTITIFINILCCRPKPQIKVDPQAVHNNKLENNILGLDAETQIKVEAMHNLRHGQHSTKIIKSEKLSRPTYTNLKKAFEIEYEKLLYNTRSGQVNIEMNMLIQKQFERRKELLFSIQVGSATEKDRNEAWITLEIDKNGVYRGGFFDNDQATFARILMENHMDSTQIEKLVIWETVRTRMDFSPGNGKRGDGSIEETLKIDMAKLLLSALGINKQELFRAASYKIRSASDEAGTNGHLAEEEIRRLQIEQTPVAEQILERYWKPDP
jgi:hypothetical protein